MKITLSRQDIQALCDRTSIQRGETYFRSGRVTHLAYDDAERRYVARVRGSRPYTVHVTPGEAGGVATVRCDCPAFGAHHDSCKHIAAVLLQLQQGENFGQAQTPGLLSPVAASSTVSPLEAAITRQKMDLGKRVLSLFDGMEQTASHQGAQPLAVEFIVSGSFPLPGRENLLTVEMKLGPRRVYVVPKIRELLAGIHKEQPYTLSKSFTYDPSEHFFRDHDRAVIQSLWEICDLERMYRSLISPYGSGYFPNLDRVLIIPPNIWPNLLPQLQAATTRLQSDGRTYDRIEMVDGPIPLSFRLDRNDEAAHTLEAHGLENLSVHAAYGCAIAQGRLYRAPANQLRRLSELQSIFTQNRGNRLTVFPPQLVPFMERVIPSLRPLGAVEVAQDVQDGFVQPPLQAKLYLDRGENGLVARLSYDYDGISVDPMRYDATYRDSAGRPLIRDTDSENRIMAILERSPLIYNGSDLALADDESVYRFAHQSLPRLEKWVEIFATPAARSLLLIHDAPPRITFNMASLSSSWFEVLFEIDDIDREEIRDILQSIMEKRTYHRLRSGALVSLETEAYRDIAGALSAMDIRQPDLSGNRLAVPMAKGLHALLERDHKSVVRLSNSVRQLVEHLQYPDSLDFPVPTELQPVLRDYQKYGYQWMKTLAHYGFGGILADDMGLGKTLQSIAFILSEQPTIRKSGNPALIVSPASLMYNWKNELKRFAPGLDTVVVDGSKQERDRICRESTADILITSYPLLRRDVATYAARDFHTLVLDEAQAIKNHGTLTAQAARQIKADHRFGLTGTPMENSLDDLWSILHTTSPALFPHKTAFTNLQPDVAARRVRPFLLRRMKTDVLRELPEKIETTQHSELSHEQKKLYMAYLARIQRETAQQLQVDGFQRSRIRILAGLTRLRQLCCHPALFVENYKGTAGKLDQLMELVDEGLASGRRILIFSQFTSMLAIIRGELARANLPTFYLDGETPAKERVELCQRFNAGEHSLFLISLKAGGTGLNLIGADTVILYDLWWNPAVEQQAADRAHRIGQKNVVQVIRLIAQGTIEEKMYELQQRKRDLIDQVLQSDGEAPPTLTEDDIREILMI